MITIKDVEHVAKLARLELTEEEKEWLQNNPNRQSYCLFDDCEDFTEDKKD